jgi:hypothetical protein
LKTKYDSGTTGDGPGWDHQIPGNLGTRKEREGKGNTKSEIRRQTMEADTTQFQATNGKPPYGIGQWRFQIGNETVSIFGKYSIAKRDAFRAAKTLGEERVVVLPDKKLAPQSATSERPEKLTAEQIHDIKARLMAQAEVRNFGKRTRTVIPVGDMKATQIMVVFDVQSKRTAHLIAKRGFYIVDYTKQSMCPGEIDIEEAYRIAKWWVYKKMGGCLPHWADSEDMVQEAVTRLIERGGDPRMAGDSYKFFMVQTAIRRYLQRNQKHEHEDEENIDAPGSRWGTWDRSYRATETMCRMIEAKGAYPMERAA